jgi:3-phenylpropionate/trans-cinnamate dioxygenase ferredoxin reductase subunit
VDGHLRLRPTDETEEYVDALDLDGSVTIIGASLAGLRCAETLRAEGFRGRITMVGDEAHRPYDRPPLTKQLLSGRWGTERVGLLDGDKEASLRLDMRLGVRATGLGVEDRTVALADGSTVTADAVVVATGATLRRLPGTETMAGVHGVRNLDDALRLRAAMEALEPESRVVVVGAGFIGQEVATQAAGLGHRVTMLEGADLPLERIVGAMVATHLAALPDAAVDVRCGVSVTGIAGPRGDARGGVVELDGAEDVPADLIVVGIGVTPATGWLEDSGLTLTNGVVTDERLVAAPGILAIGDVARFLWRSPAGDEHVRIEHWQMAVDHGVHAARVLLGGAAAPAFEAVPYFWSDVWGKKIQMLGHPSPTDEVEMAIAPDEDGRLLALYRRGDVLTGVLGVSKPRQLMAFRALLAAGAGIGDARLVEL